MITTLIIITLPKEAKTVRLPGMSLLTGQCYANEETSNHSHVNNKEVKVVFTY